MKNRKTLLLKKMLMHPKKAQRQRVRRNLADQRRKKRSPRKRRSIRRGLVVNKLALLEAEMRTKRKAVKAAAMEAEMKMKSTARFANTNRARSINRNCLKKKRSMLKKRSLLKRKSLLKKNDNDETINFCSLISS